MYCSSYSPLKTKHTGFYCYRAGAKPFGAGKPAPAELDSYVELGLSMEKICHFAYNGSTYA